MPVGALIQINAYSVKSPFAFQTRIPGCTLSNNSAAEVARSMTRIHGEAALELSKEYSEAFLRRGDKAQAEHWCKVAAHLDQKHTG